VVTIGAVVIVVACFLQWWQLGGGPGELAATSGIGITDSGFLLFIAAVVTILLIALPYMSDGPVSIDRPVSYLLLLGVAVVAFAWRVVDMMTKGLLLYQGQTPPIQPLRGPGFWIAALGLMIMARGVFELWDARHRF
jgi:hypothetical protein